MTTRQSKLLTGYELADVLNVSPGTVRSWARHGMPVAERGRRGDRTRPNRYRVTDARAWLREREREKLAAIAARARKERAYAIVAEQTVAIRARDLIPREEAERAWPAECSRVRRNLRGWVKPLAKRIHAATKDGERGVEAALRTAVHKKLTELAQPTRDPEVKR